MSPVTERGVLLTGFTAFGRVAVNPSQLIVERLNGCFPWLMTAVLPVEYSGSQAAIETLLRQHQPDLLIGLGVAQGRKKISLERIAVNLDDAALPDNTGVTRDGQPIVADGPAAYWSTLPLEAMHAALTAENVPVHFSNHAGTYICNHLFYTARHLVETWSSPVACGFVHLPAIDETSENGLPFELLLRAVQIILHASAS